MSDVVAACLARVAELDGAIGAFRIVDEQGARGRAKQLDDAIAGPLQGLVVGIKDVIDTADLPTGYGSALFADHQPAADADAVAALRRAGAIVLGKTESTEFAMFQPTRTRNPVDPGRTPGGSSSGSAAAVAAGMVPVALGTQTAGSVVRPAAYCGVYGFKPSWGWTSTTGIWRLSEPLDTVGLFARSVADLLLTYRVLRTGTPPAAGSAGPPYPPGKPSVAVLSGAEWGNCDGDVRDALSAVADRLADHGWRVREMAMPPAWRHLPGQQEVVMAAEVAKNLHATLGERVGQISASARAIVERGDSLPGQRVPRRPGGQGRGAARARAALRRHRSRAGPERPGRRPGRPEAHRRPGHVPAVDAARPARRQRAGLAAAGRPAHRRPVDRDRTRRRQLPHAPGLGRGRTHPLGGRNMNYDFVNVCREELILCGVHEGEAVAILSSDAEGELLGHAAAFMQAAKELGALPYHVRVPAARGKGAATWEVGTTPLTGHPAAMAALKEASIVIDLVFMLFSKEQLEIQASGTRILLAVEPIDVLSRLLPDRQLRERVEFAGDLLAAAQSLRIEHENGTNLVYRLGKYPTITEYGYTDEPGRWDHWPSGFLFTGAYEDGVDGTMILAPGTIIYPFKSYVRTPIRLQIESGKIVDISGELDAELMRDYMEQFNDPDGYAISHIGWGLNEKARWSAPMMDTRGIGQEGRSFYGNVLFATGPNQELGGSNASPCHIDIPLHGYSLYLDDRQIVQPGRHRRRRNEAARLI